ncbi:MAG: DUF1080 domain-containing protein [Blastocatellia bacterium]|nr:DUF1080 domain-containing protein [Blastocatellia bacterium]
MQIKFVPSVKSIIIVTMLAVLALSQNKNSQTINQLTEAEKKSGWRLLFDGKTFNGWRGFHSDKVPEGWVLEDGAIKKTPGVGALGSAGGDLISSDEFSNFELQVEWKISPGGNSGIKYLVTEDLPPKGKSAVSFEYQVLDDDKHPDAKAGIDGDRTSGSLYDLIPPLKGRKLKPVGEYNEARIIVKGNHIEHWLNGVKVVEFDRSSADFKERIAKSKFKNIKGFGEAAKGHILLQDHGNAVWFRNIKIRNL